MIAAPRNVVPVISSSSTSQPSTIATTGFTYAYVATFEIGAFCSSHAYAVNATQEPNTIR